MMAATNQTSQPGREPAILAESLGKRFGEVRALDGVDLELPAGKVLALLGPNGAGKTTMVRILATLLAPDVGRARVAGFDVVTQARAVRRLIGLSGQYAAVDAYLTGRENLRMIGRLYGLTRDAARRRAEELLERFDLVDAGGRRAGTYSGGMRRRLDVAASLVAAPPVLFLDEPTTGLDPHGRNALWQLLDELTAQGTSLLLTTQYMEEADRLADAIVVIDKGQVVATGTADQLKHQVGGDRLELHAGHGEDPRDLARALAGLGSGPPRVDVAAGRVLLAVADGPALLPEVATRLAASDLRVADLALRRPSLEDVFLTLTGHPGSETTDAEDEDSHPAIAGSRRAPAERSAA
jgi:ABC-2 type transport system ATP-binding protein